MEKSGDFLKYVTTTTIREELDSQMAKNWEQKHGKQLLLTLKYGDEVWLENEHISMDGRSSEEHSDSIDEADYNQLATELEEFSNNALDQEFHKLVWAKSNGESFDVMHLLKVVEEYQRRGINPPNKRTKKPAQNKSGCSLAFLILGTLITWTLFNL